MSEQNDNTDQISYSQRWSTTSYQYLTVVLSTNLQSVCFLVCWLSLFM